jgi:hypothetical protein
MIPASNVYPLYSAYKFRRYAIFISLLKSIKDTPDSTVEEKLSKIIVQEEASAITLEAYISNNMEKDDDHSRGKYLISLRNKKAGKPDDLIADENYTKAVTDFYKAIEDEQADFETVKKYANNVIDDIGGKKYNSRGQQGGEPLLITVLTKYKDPGERYKIIEYLLDEGFSVNAEKNLLCIAAKMAVDDRSYFEILRYLIDNTNRYLAAFGGGYGID